MRLRGESTGKSKGNRHHKYSSKTKFSRRGNGHFRSRIRKLEQFSRLGHRSSWHHVWYFSEEHGRIIDYDVLPPKSYWKKISNRVVRYSRDVPEHNGYRKIFDLWGLV